MIGIEISWWRRYDEPSISDYSEDTLSVCFTPTVCLVSMLLFLSFSCLSFHSMNNSCFMVLRLSMKVLIIFVSSCLNKSKFWSVTFQLEIRLLIINISLCSFSRCVL